MPLTILQNKLDKDTWESLNLGLLIKIDVILVEVIIHNYFELKKIYSFSSLAINYSHKHRMKSSR
jgi:hypothetical protein